MLFEHATAQAARVRKTDGGSLNEHSSAKIQGQALRRLTLLSTFFYSFAVLDRKLKKEKNELTGYLKIRCAKNFGQPAAESFFGTLKSECIFNSVYRTREETHLDIISYIEIFYYSIRRHSYLGYQAQ